MNPATYSVKRTRSANCPLESIRKQSCNFLVYPTPLICVSLENSLVLQKGKKVFLKVNFK